jgi:hypothetical protein
MKPHESMETHPAPKPSEQPEAPAARDLVDALVRRFGDVWIASIGGMAACGATREDAIAGLDDCVKNGIIMSEQLEKQTSQSDDSVAAAKSWLETVSLYIDEERLHDDENSFLEMYGPLLQVNSDKYGFHYYRVTLTPITKEEYFEEPNAGGQGHLPAVVDAATKGEASGG